MIKVDVLGVGVWSSRFGNWNDLCSGLAGGEWPEAPPPESSLLPPAIRRRAPLSVKMAADVMQQACEMARMEPTEMATVYSSSFGDMVLTDRICSTLNDDPRMTSPTHFHNSVHNAATGYWTIATGAQKPSNAVSAFGPPPVVCLLEAASQAVFEEMPVLLVSGEVEPPQPLGFTTSKQAPFAAAMILAADGSSVRPLAKMRISVEEGGAEPMSDDRLPDGLGEEPDACLLNVLAAIPDLSPDNPRACFSVSLSKALRLRAELATVVAADA